MRKSIEPQLSPFAFAMREARLRQVDMVNMTGKSRTTVWRWQNGKLPVPEYAWSIVRLQKRVRDLTASLAESLSGRT